MVILVVAILRTIPCESCKSKDLNPGLVTSPVLIGSPGRTRFELLRPKMLAARTSSISFRRMAYAQNWHAHPDWVPSRDPSRTTENEHLRAENPVEAVDTTAVRRHYGFLVRYWYSVTVGADAIRPIFAVDRHISRRREGEKKWCARMD